MVVCQICGKGVQYGHLIRHGHSGQWEKRATKNRKIFLPNLHSGMVLVDGVTKRAKACASCLSKYRVPYKNPALRAGTWQSSALLAGLSPKVAATV